MEKPSKAPSKGNKIFKYLSKATSFTIGTAANPEIRPFHHHHNAHNKGFSGPIVSIVPEEARRRKKKPNSAFHGGEDDDDEPTSPKVSCIGQIKHKNSKCKDSFKAARRPPPAPAAKPTTTTRKPALAMKRMFTRKVRPGGGRRSEEGREAGPEQLAREPPKLGMMKRYASGRETLAGFDWRKEEFMMSDDEEWEEEEEEEVIVPHSAPILMGGGGAVAVEPKKEVSLWKRRTSHPPMPLQVS